MSSFYRNAVFISLRLEVSFDKFLGTTDIRHICPNDINKLQSLLSPETQSFGNFSPSMLQMIVVLKIVGQTVSCAI